MTIALRFIKLNEKATLPKYQNYGDAGFDFHATIEMSNPCFILAGNKISSNTEDIAEENCLVVQPMSQCIVNTGLASSFPLGYEIQIRPRSGLAFKHSLTVTNSPGTLDSKFRDEIKILLFNMGNKPFIIKQGDRIAQGVLNKLPKVAISEIVNFDYKDMKNDRGGGFGSTGVQ